MALLPGEVDQLCAMQRRGSLDELALDRARECAFGTSLAKNRTMDGAFSEQRGMLEPTVVVDHIQPHRGDAACALQAMLDMLDQLCAMQRSGEWLGSKQFTEIQKFSNSALFYNRWRVIGPDNDGSPHP